MSELKAGDAAPDFTLPTDDGEISLAALRGKPVVLYVYPKDDTSGCTVEAQDFTRLQPRFDAAGVVVIGLSKDSARSHAKFRTKYALTHKLASDESLETLQAYGVWGEKTLYGRKYMGAERATFLIDREGKIARVWRKVKIDGHADEVLEAASDL
jgi:peroxiredoxin Q/BCP